MKTLRLNLSTEGLDLIEEEKKKSPIELATIVIKNMMLISASQSQHRGMDEEERRKFYKISDVFDKAVKEDLESVELEDDWFGQIKKAKREGRFTPSNLWRRVEELIDEVKDR